MTVPPDTGKLREYQWRESSQPRLKIGLFRKPIFYNPNNTPKHVLSPQLMQNNLHLHNLKESAERKKFKLSEDHCIWEKRTCSSENLSFPIEVRTLYSSSTLRYPSTASNEMKVNMLPQFAADQRDFLLCGMLGKNAISHTGKNRSIGFASPSSDSTFCC